MALAADIPLFFAGSAVLVALAHVPAYRRLRSRKRRLRRKLLQEEVDV